MLLRDLLQGTPVTAVQADPEMEIAGISYDSRTVRPGDLFAAIAGEEYDGAQFIPQALERGAVCVLAREACSNIPCVVVPDPRRALAELAANYFGHPAKDLTLVGVTGTNGKTTSTYLIKHILEKTLGARVGLMGTICNMVDDRVLPARRTTPESLDLQRLLYQMRCGGCTHVVMEVSSHALALGRVHGLTFDAALFTNLTQDHLDFHGTMEAYAQAKAGLFQNCRLAVYNADDPWHELLLAQSPSARVSYGLDTAADLTAGDIDLRPGGASFLACREGEEVPVQLLLPGRFNIYNALGALAVCQGLGVPLWAGAAALASCGGARGRMEVVPTPGKDYTVLIDYAHTPDALEKVLTALRGLTRGRIIAVFGCGGDRDRTKRPEMGAIAARLSDVAVVTSDNPRTEEPMAIIRDILQGMPPEGYVVEVDRIRAIGLALSLAKSGDVVVLCGKGHETYQEIGTQRIHLDERQIVAQLLRET